MRKWLIFILFIFSAVASGQTGKLAGYVFDKETGESLPGVNISIIGTYKGASSDADGFYHVSDLVPAEYTLEISFIGYKVTQMTGVVITEDNTTTIDIQLESTILALGQEIEVIGKKPLLDLQETSTNRRLSSDDIKKTIANDAIDLVSQQVGIVKQDNAIYVRGGRAYESQYIVDGVSVQDPLSGTGFGLNVSANAIEEIEVISGGFSAEYGQATSGVVKVKTKSGSDKYTGSFSYKSDHLGLFKDQDFSFNGDQYEFGLSGPEPISGLLKDLGLKLPGNIYFYLSFYTNISDDYTGATSSQLFSSIAPKAFDPETFAPRQNNNWSGIFKLTWKYNPTNTFTWSVNRSLIVNQNTQLLQTNLEYVEASPGFPYNYSKNLDNFNTYSHDNEKLALMWSHTFSPTTFSELRLSRFFTHLRSDWQGNSWQDYSQPFDIARLPVDYFFPDSTQIRVIPGDGFYDYGNAFIWHDHYVEDYSIKGDITSRVSDNHTFKTGFEASFKELQVIDIADAWIGDFGSGQDIYRVHPADGAFYIQDDVKSSGFILNAGLRLDWWAPGELADRAIADTSNLFLTDGMRKKYRDETIDVFGRKVKLRLMPRVGVSFPISNNQMLYFNYGHFSKRPKPQFVYAKLTNSDVKDSFQKYGNPSLSPETSVKYELGVRHKFGEDNVISFTAFYKDIFDYVQTVSTNIERVGRAVFYINQDYARSNGIELEYKTRIGKYIFGTFNTSWSVTTTKSSDADLAQLIEDQSLPEPPIREVHAAWDRPWKTGANLAIRVPENHNPEFLGVNVFSDWSLNLRFFAQAGRRYTPQDLTGFNVEGRPLYNNVEDQSQVYSKIGTTWHWFDLNFTKFYHFSGIDFGLFLEIKNLFDAKNAQIINPVTGDAYETGDDVPSGWNDPRYPDRSFPISSPFPYNPARYRAPRHIRFGMSVSF